MQYVIYTRVSTDTQEESGLGLEAQKHACLEYIRKQGGGVYLEFSDTITGTNRSAKALEDRPQLIEALAVLRPGDVLLTAKRDRMTRNTYLNLMIEADINKSKAMWVTADGSNDGHDPHDVLLRRIMDAFAEYEAMIISVRTKAALQRKKARGERTGHIPYGKYLVGDKLVINQTERDVLKVMWTLRQEGHTFREIASEMNARGFRNRGGAVWTHGATSRVYKNYEAMGQVPS